MCNDFEKKKYLLVNILRKIHKELLVKNMFFQEVILTKKINKILELKNT